MNQTKTPQKNIVITSCEVQAHSNQMKAILCRVGYVSVDLAAKYVDTQVIPKHIHDKYIPQLV